MTSLTSLIINTEQSVRAPLTPPSAKAQPKAPIQQKSYSLNLGLGVGTITFIATSFIHSLVQQAQIRNTLLSGGRYQATSFSQVFKEIGYMALGSAAVGLTAGLVDLGRRLIQRDRA